MSTYDMEEVIPSSFKYTLSGNQRDIGFYMPMVSEIREGIAPVYETTTNHYGPLLLINKLQQNWAIDCNISVDYEYGIQSGYTQMTSFGRTVYYPFYLTGYTGNCIISIPSGSAPHRQFLYTGHTTIYKLLHVEASENYQQSEIYLLGDNSIKILHSFNTENERNNLQRAVDSIAVSPPDCILCTGVGLYSGASCPLCDGYGHRGYNAMGFLLEERAKALNVQRRSTSDEQLQYIAWGKKAWIIPTIENIKRFVWTLTSVPMSFIDVYGTGDKELKIIVRFPLMYGGTSSLQTAIVDLKLKDRPTIQTVLEEICPAGVNLIVYPYYGLRDESEMDYSPSGYTSRGIFFGLGYVSEWGNKFFISGLTGECTSGAQGDGTQGMRFFTPKYYLSDAAYSGLTSGNYEEIFKYQTTWYSTGTSITPPYTGEYKYR